MIHQMGLYKAPFQSIKAGRKTVEVRLNDEKREKLRIGDNIIFTKLPEKDDQLEVEIINLTIYPTFKEMYTKISAQAFDSIGETIDDLLASTYEIYSKKQEEQFGTLAIEIKHIS